jgi:hypothetical protein
MNEEKLKRIVQRMIDNNEPPDKIREVVRRGREMMASNEDLVKKEEEKKPTQEEQKPVSNKLYQDKDNKLYHVSPDNESSFINQYPGAKDITGSPFDPFSKDVDQSFNAYETIEREEIDQAPERKELTSAEIQDKFTLPKDAQEVGSPAYIESQTMEPVKGMGASILEDKISGRYVEPAEEKIKSEYEAWLKEKGGDELVEKESFIGKPFTFPSRVYGEFIQEKTEKEKQNLISQGYSDAEINAYSDGFYKNLNKNFKEGVTPYDRTIWTTMWESGDADRFTLTPYNTSLPGQEKSDELIYQARNKFLNYEGKRIYNSDKQSLITDLSLDYENKGYTVVDGPVLAQPGIYSISKSQIEQEAQNIIDQNRSKVIEMYVSEDFAKLKELENKLIKLSDENKNNTSEYHSLQIEYDRLHEDLTSGAKQLFNPYTEEYVRKNPSINEMAEELVNSNTPRRQMELEANQLMYELVSLNSVFTDKNLNIAGRLIEDASISDLAGELSGQASESVEMGDRKKFTRYYDILTGGNKNWSLKEDMARMSDSGKPGERLAYQLSTLPNENNELSAFYNQKLNQFLAYTKALEFNYDPVTLDQTGFFDNFVSGVVGVVLDEGSMQGMLQKGDTEAKNFVEAKRELGHEISKEEEERIKDRTVDLVTGGLGEFGALVVTMAALKRPVAAGGRYLSAMFGETKIGSTITNAITKSPTLSTTVELLGAGTTELAAGVATDKVMKKALGTHEMGWQTWLGFGIGGKISEKVINRFLNPLLIGEYSGGLSLKRAYSNSPTFRGMMNNTISATSGTVVADAVEIFDAAFKGELSTEKLAEITDSQKNIVLWSQLFLMGGKSTLMSIPPEVRKLYVNTSNTIMGYKVGTPEARAAAKRLNLDIKDINVDRLKKLYESEVDRLYNDPKYAKDFDPKTKAAFANTELARRIDQLDADFQTVKFDMDVTAIQNEIKKQNGSKYPFERDTRISMSISENIIDQINQKGEYELTAEQVEFIAKTNKTVLEYGMTGGDVANLDVRNEAKRIKSEAIELTYELENNGFKPGTETRKKALNILLESRRLQRQEIKLKEKRQAGKGSEVAIKQELKKIKERQDVLAENLGEVLTENEQFLETRRQEEIKRSQDLLAKDYKSKPEDYMVFETTAEAQKAAGKEGVELPGEGVYTEGDKIIIDLQKAREVGNIAVGMHEALHKVMEPQLKDPKQLKKLVKDFIKELSWDELQEVELMLKKQGKDPKEYKDVEWFNAFNDAIIEGRIELKDNSNMFKKLANKLVSKTPFTNAKVPTGKQAYDLIKDFATREAAKRPVEKIKQVDAKQPVKDDDLSFFEETAKAAAEGKVKVEEKAKAELTEYKSKELLKKGSLKDDKGGTYKIVPKEKSKTGEVKTWSLNYVDNAGKKKNIGVFETQRQALEATGVKYKPVGAKKVSRTKTDVTKKPKKVTTKEFENMLIELKSAEPREKDFVDEKIPATAKAEYRKKLTSMFENNKSRMTENQTKAFQKLLNDPKFQPSKAKEVKDKVDIENFEETEKVDKSPERSKYLDDVTFEADKWLRENSDKKDTEKYKKVQQTLEKAAGEYIKSVKGKYSSTRDIGPQVNEMYDKMSKIWNKGGSDFVFSQVYENKLLHDLIGRRIDSFVLKGKPPGWTSESRNDLIEQTYLEFLPHIRNFNKAYHNREANAIKNDNLFAWVNSYMNEKVGNSFKKIGLKPEFDVDVTEAKDVTYGEEINYGEERKEIEKAEERDFSLRKKIGLGDNFKQRVIDKVKGVMRGKLPAVNSPEFKSKLEREFERELFDIIREELFGAKYNEKKKQYQYDWNKVEESLNEFAEAVYDKLPIQTLVSLNRQTWKKGELIMKPVIDPKTGEQKRMTPEESDNSIELFGYEVKDRNAGNPVWTKENSTKIKEDFVNFFLNPIVSRKGMRMEGLFKVLAKEIAFDATMETVKDPATYERMKDIYEIQDIELFGNELEVIAKQIDRNPNFRFSETTYLNSSPQYLNKSAENLKISPKGFLGRLSEVYGDVIKNNLSYEAAAEKYKNQEKVYVDILENNNIFKKHSFTEDTVGSLNAKSAEKQKNKNVKKLLEQSAESGTIEEAWDFMSNVDIPSNLIDAIVKKGGAMVKELFGFHYKTFDSAKTKENIEYKQISDTIKDLNSKLKIAKGENKKQIQAEIDNLKELQKELKELKQHLRTDIKGDFISGEYYDNSVKFFDNKASGRKADNKDYKWVEKVQAYNTSSGIMFRVNKIRTSEKSPEARLKEIQESGDFNKIAEANVANKKLMNKILELYYESLVKNPTKWKGFSTFLKKQATGVHGFRALSSFDLIELKAETTKDVKAQGEHMLASAIILNRITEIFAKGLAEGKTPKEWSVIKNEIAQVVENNSQGLFDKATSKKLDNKLGKTSNLNKLRIYALENFPEIYTLDGKKAEEYIAKEQFDNFTNSANVINRNSNSKRLNKSNVVKEEKPLNNEDVLSLAATMDAALKNARDPNTPVKKIRIFDFDDTLARTKSNVLYTMPDGKKGKLTAEEFAKKGEEMAAKGAQWDFSEFNKVVDGKKGPLFQVAEAIQKARGTEDVFVLTARAPESAVAIKDFLKSVGLDIPIENVTGLGDSSPFAKSKWVVEKAAEGYNDFYFADDAYKNVRAVQDALSVIDVKSRVQQARYSTTADLSLALNKMIEIKTGIPAEKRFDQLAKSIGRRKGKGKFFMPYSAEDFMGLMYPLIAKGKVGDAQLKLMEEALFKPFNRAMNNISKDRVQITRDFKELKSNLKNVPKNLTKEAIPESGLTYENVVRLYLWDKQGIEIDGVNAKTMENVWEIMQEKPELQAFADQMLNINKGDGYYYPGELWLTGNMTSDLYSGINKTKRKKYLEEWKTNKDIIFNKENMLKLEAAYGPKYVEALRDILRRMETGVNRPENSSRFEDRTMNWLNGSVGVTMFYNVRSAVLQTISTVNYLNWSDNNIFKAGKAYANAPQFAKDWLYLMRSDFMKDRRSGLKINVSESEIADAAKKNGAKGVINKLLQSGFSLTKGGDAFAIATGGAPFYRNRIKTYEKQGFETKEAEKKAFDDFRELTEQSQQSSRADKISQQQADKWGRVILAFTNTPMQYNRIMKRSAQDLINKRGDWKTHVSRIMYYGAIQNFIFNSLQQALFAMSTDDLDSEDNIEKYSKVANGMFDSILRGGGYGGALLSVLKNFGREVYEQTQKEGLTNYSETWIELAGIAPPLQGKIRRFVQAGKSLDYGKKDAEEMGWKFSFDNPNYLASASFISGLTNIPLDRAMRKADNIIGAFSGEFENWQRVALLLGWNKWNLETPEQKESRERLKKKKSKTRRKKTYDEKKKKKSNRTTSVGLIAD